MNVIVRLPHPQSGDSQGQETFLAPSADKQTRNYDIECSYIATYLHRNGFTSHFHISQLFLQKTAPIKFVNSNSANSRL